MRRWVAHRSQMPSSERWPDGGTLGFCRKSPRAREPAASSTANPSRRRRRPDVSRALLRQGNGLEPEWPRVLPLVVADDVRQLAFRDPGDVADLRHRNRLGKAVLDGRDLGLAAFDRHIVELAVPLDQEEA